MTIEKEDIKQLVIQRNQFLNSQTILEDDQPLVFDSLSLLWFIEGLNEKYGVSLKAHQLQSDHFQSITTIYDLLQQVSKTKV